MIKLEHVKKEYPNVTPLQDVTVEVHKDDVISIIRAISIKSVRRWVWFFSTLIFLDI